MRTPYLLPFFILIISILTYQAGANPSFIVGTWASETAQDPNGNPVMAIITFEEKGTFSVKEGIKLAKKAAPKDTVTDARYGLLHIAGSFSDRKGENIIRVKHEEYPKFWIKPKDGNSIYIYTPIAKQNIDCLLRAFKQLTATKIWLKHIKPYEPGPPEPPESNTVRFGEDRNTLDFSGSKYIYGLYSNSSPIRISEIEKYEFLSKSNLRERVDTYPVL